MTLFDIRYRDGFSRGMELRSLVIGERLAREDGGRGGVFDNGLGEQLTQQGLFLGGEVRSVVAAAVYTVGVEAVIECAGH